MRYVIFFVLFVLNVWGKMEIVSEFVEKIREDSWKKLVKGDSVEDWERILIVILILIW